MVWKKLTPAYTGDAQKLGGVDYNKLIDLLTNIDVVDDVIINSDWMFRNGKLRLRNTADTASYTILAGNIDADRNLTLPVLTGDDTVVTANATQTLNNKTINGNITGITDASIDPHTSTKITITAKSQLNNALVYTDQANTFGDFDQKIRNTRLKLMNPANTNHINLTVPAIVSDITWTFPTTSDTFVGRNTTDTLTGKTMTNPTLNSPTISTILNSPGTLTLPTSTDTLVGRATTDTLTNKTIDYTNNTITNLPSSGMPFPSVKKTGMLSGVGTTGNGILAGMANSTTPAANWESTPGSFLRYSTGTSTGTTSGLRIPSVFTCRGMNPRLKVKWRHSTTSSNRFYIGFSSNVGVLGNNDTPLAIADHGFIFGKRDSDTNYHTLRNDGATSVTAVDTGITVTAGVVRTLELKANAASNNFTYSFDGGSAVAFTSDIPSATAGLTIHVVHINTSTTNDDLDIFYVEVESDL